MDYKLKWILSIVFLTSIPLIAIAEPNDGITPIQEVKPIDLTNQERVDFYADKWKVSRAEMHATIRCESGYNSQAYNGNDVHRYSVGSLGIAQFSQQTFEHYAKKMGESYSNPYNPDEALDVMAYMFSIGQKRHWTCWVKFFG